MNTIIKQAIAVLNQAAHRGARSWEYDHQTGRVMPAGWSGHDIMPAFTPFEALAVARRLVEIGAGQPERVG